jgi:hypothetical protein
LAGKIPIAVKNPGLEDQALISPRRGGGVYLETSIGMMECWNNGILGFKNGIYADFNPCFVRCIEKKISSF